MLKDKKVIGVCITKIHDNTNAHLINRLHFLARKKGYKLIFFNSFIDFYNNDIYDEGSRSIYEIINFDIVDATVIFDNGFNNKDIVKSIIDASLKHSTPVVTVNAQYDGCFAVLEDYEEAYKSVIRHVIKDHGVTDTFYMAGNEENDPASEGRINCYREVLEECGLEFDESRVGYGHYWDIPAKDVMYGLWKEKKIPKAVFCANDYMAMAVCDFLREVGYRVPEDVIVTGFDGVTKTKYFSPQITTCSEDLDVIASLCIDAVDTAVEGKSEPCVFTSKYTADITESCGCKKTTNEDFRRSADDLYTLIDSVKSHEDYMHSWQDKILNIDDMNDLFNVLAGCILEESHVCINSNFLASAMDFSIDNNDVNFTDELVVISSRYSYTDYDKTEKMSVKDMIPNLKSWHMDDSSYVLNAIFVGSTVCGYYAVKTDSLFKCANRIMRVLNAINIAFNVAINCFKQAKMQMSIDNASITDPISGLPNIKGTSKWFDEFSQKPENHNLTLSVSVYGLPKYTYILENYGIGDAENAIKFVSESLKLANPKDCFIGHISEDEFVVINYYTNPSAISDTINNATSVFYSVIEGYNSTSNKEYYIEVNCGCTVVDPGWNSPLEAFIKFANSEMYMNRLKSGMGVVIKDKTSPKVHYKAFDLLVDKNLFNYHFQPIVNAKTGDIYGYEALMRTDDSIGMNPLQVLEVAKEYNKLYEIERATMFNVMECYVDKINIFGDKKVFINTIPGYFLNDDDINVLTDKYKEYMSNIVFELSEQDTISDNELNAIKKLNGNNANQIAIDDYGTGYSNIVNLIRYAPQLIKIDRFLISEIDRNQNKQMFVRSTIDFARLNKIKVLAEGVETYNEMRMVIDLGVDLIQGFYTGRPVADPITEIDPEIKKEITSLNPLWANDK